MPRAAVAERTRPCLRAAPCRPCHSPPVGSGAEGKMIEAGRILKQASADLGRPSIAVLAYFNSVLDWTAYDFHTWMQVCLSACLPA